MSEPALAATLDPSQVSVGIAEYVKQNGLAIFAERYSFQSQLSDGRLLNISFHDLEGSGDRMGMNNSILQVSVTAVLDSHHGYKAVEHGLSGRWSEYTILLGPPNNRGDVPFYAPKDQIPIHDIGNADTIRILQEGYQSDMQQILEELRGE